MATAHKKVVIRRFEADPLWGYLPASGFLAGEQVVLLLPDGRTNPIPFGEIKLIAYVRDFNLADKSDPERMGRRSFAGRPRGEGIWLRVEFRDGDLLEGLAGFDAGFIDMLIEDRGLMFSPPDGRANTQKVFVPRPAIRTVELMGAIVSPAKKAAATGAKAAVEELQAGLFER